MHKLLQDADDGLGRLRKDVASGFEGDAFFYPIPGTFHKGLGDKGRAFGQKYGYGHYALNQCWPAIGLHGGQRSTMTGCAFAIK